MHFMNLAYAFPIDGQITSCKNFGHGHINSTFLIETDAGKTYVLQKINKYVFSDPVKVMKNAGSVTDFLRTKIDDLNGALHFLHTTDNEFCLQDDEGEYWRMYHFVEGICLNAPRNNEDFYQSALAFGRFQEALVDYPAHTLYETIPNFHNTPDRFRQLKEAIEKDAAGRAADVQPEIDFALKREEAGGTLQRMLDEGKLPLRVTHNDTKLNNVLLHPETGKSLCVLDLDTVMPGLSAFDFGDSIRFGAATAAEDEPDPSKMKLDLELFEVYTKGFLEAAPSLTPPEVDVLPMGAYIMTLEVGIRFLADYLNGDVYFKTAYPEHNLVRARTQLALVADMEQKWDQMQHILQALRTS